MPILAIDPGYGRCGLAVLSKDAKNGGKETLLFSTCVETSAAIPFPERLAAVVAGCRTLIDRFSPPEAAIEKLYFTKNQKTAMHVAEVRGALLSLLQERSIAVSEYGPGEVKSAVAGSGRADKKSLARMVRLLVPISKEILLDDEYDAIAIGLTHLALRRSGRQDQA